MLTMKTICQEWQEENHSTKTAIRSYISMRGEATNMWNKVLCQRKSTLAQCQKTQDRAKVHVGHEDLYTRSHSQSYDDQSM